MQHELVLVTNRWRQQSVLGHGAARTKQLRRDGTVSNTGSDAKSDAESDAKSNTGANPQSDAGATNAGANANLCRWQVSQGRHKRLRWVPVWQVPGPTRVLELYEL